MKEVDHLSTRQKKQLPKLNLPNKKKKQPIKKKKENLSEYDIRELMGMNRDTYKRGKGGAMRRK